MRSTNLNVRINFITLIVGAGIILGMHYLTKGNAANPNPAPAPAPAPGPTPFPVTAQQAYPTRESTPRVRVEYAAEAPVYVPPVRTYTPPVVTYVNPPVTYYEAPAVTTRYYYSQSAPSYYGGSVVSGNCANGACGTSSSIQGSYGIGSMYGSYSIQRSRGGLFRGGSVMGGGGCASCQQ